MGLKGQSSQRAAEEKSCSQSHYVQSSRRRCFQVQGVLDLPPICLTKVQICDVLQKSDLLPVLTLIVGVSCDPNPKVTSWQLTDCSILQSLDDDLQPFFFF